MDDVRCSSSSSQLLECPSNHLLTHDCDHSHDAGVECEGCSSFSFGEVIFIQCVIKQLLVQLGISDLLVVTFQMRGEWRSVWTMSGAQFVMMVGALKMLQLCADS